MKKLFLLLGFVVSLMFSGIAFAVGIPDGAGIVMISLSNQSWPVATNPNGVPLQERMCPVAPLNFPVMSGQESSSYITASAVLLGHFDTGDPTKV